MWERNVRWKERRKEAEKIISWMYPEPNKHRGSQKTIATHCVDSWEISKSTSARIHRRSCRTIIEFFAGATRVEITILWCMWWWKILKAERHTAPRHREAKRKWRSEATEKPLVATVRKSSGLWESFLVHLGNITWSTNTRRRIGCKRSREEKHNYIQSTVRVIFTVSTLCSLRFIRSTSDDLWEKFFIFFSSFRLLYFLAVFSVQLVNSSLTHDVPWMLLRASIADFSFFFPLWSRKKREN